MTVVCFCWLKLWKEKKILVPLRSSIKIHAYIQHIPIKVRHRTIHSTECCRTLLIRNSSALTRKKATGLDRYRLTALSVSFLISVQDY